jgi:hypothetical protein
MLSDEEAQFLVRTLSGLRSSKQQQQQLQQRQQQQLLQQRQQQPDLTDPDDADLRAHREAMFMLQISSLRERDDVPARLHMCEERLQKTRAALQASEAELSATRGAQGELEQKLQAANAEVSRLRKQVEMLTENGEQQALRAREERAELLRKQIVRRMMNQGLASGWAAWHALWVARTNALSRLRRVAGRLKWPALSSALRGWRRVYEAGRQARERLEATRRQSTLHGEAASLAAELAAARAEHAETLAGAEEQRERELSLLRVELTHGAEQRAALQAEQEKEERVELLRRQFTRRLKNRELSGGWQAWYDLWAARSHALRWLAKAASRMAKPALVAAFSGWKDACQWARRSAALRQKLASQRVAEDTKSRGERLLAERRHEAATIIARVAERRRQALAQRAALRRLPHWPAELPLPSAHLLPLPTGFAQMRWQQAQAEAQADARERAHTEEQLEEHRLLVAAERAKIESATRGLMEERRLSGLSSPASMHEYRF